MEAAICKARSLSPERAEERKAECSHPYSHPFSSLILSFLLGHPVFPSFSFSLSPFLLFLPISSFFLFHILPFILPFPLNAQIQPWFVEWMGLSFPPERLQCLPVVKGCPPSSHQPIVAPWVPGCLSTRIIRISCYWFLAPFLTDRVNWTCIGTTPLLPKYRMDRNTG